MCFSKSFTENKSSSNFQCKQFATIHIFLLQPKSWAISRFTYPLDQWSLRNLHFCCERINAQLIFQCKQFTTTDISLLQPNCSAFANFQLIRKRDNTDSLGFSYYAKQKLKQTSFIVENIYSYIADARSQIFSSDWTWDLCHQVYTWYIWLDPPSGVSKHRERNIIFQTSRYSAWDALVCIVWFGGKDS